MNSRKYQQIEIIYCRNCSYFLSSSQKYLLEFDLNLCIFWKCPICNKSNNFNLNSSIHYNFVDNFVITPKHKTIKHLIIIDYHLIYQMMNNHYFYICQHNSINPKHKTLQQLINNSKILQYFNSIRGGYQRIIKKKNFNWRLFNDRRQIHKLEYILWLMDKMIVSSSCAFCFYNERQQTYKLLKNEDQLKQQLLKIVKKEQCWDINRNIDQIQQIDLLKFENIVMFNEYFKQKKRIKLGKLNLIGQDNFIQFYFTQNTSKQKDKNMRQTVTQQIKSIKIQLDNFSQIQSLIKQTLSKEAPAFVFFNKNKQIINKSLLDSIFSFSHGVIHQQMLNTLKFYGLNQIANQKNIKISFSHQQFDCHLNIQPQCLLDQYQYMKEIEQIFQQ